MDVQPYQVQLEIAGATAMFNRPDCGSSFVSYPAPTFSAAKGVFDAIARLKSAYIHPTRVEICRPVQYERYTTNYRGPLRKRKKGAGVTYQLKAMVLVDVCYRLYGEVREASACPVPTNHLHALREMFNRRLANGQFFSTPFLGWREFTPSYVGPFREGTRKEQTLNVDVPCMLYSVFDRPVAGDYNPTFYEPGRDRRISAGVLTYAD